MVHFTSFASPFISTTLTIFGGKYKLRSLPLYNFLHLSVTSIPLAHYPQHCLLKHNLCSAITARDQVYSFMAYLAMLLIAQIIRRRIMWWLENIELDSIWKEWVVAVFRRLMKSRRICWDSRFASRDLIPRPPESEAVLSAILLRLFWESIHICKKYTED